MGLKGPLCLKSECPRKLPTRKTIKGLKKKNKASNVSVVSTLEDFTGTYEMDGKTYDVTGEFHGYTYLPAEMEIVVNFTSRK